MKPATRYITKEKSGLNWLIHAWFLFKKSPIIWMGLFCFIDIIKEIMLMASITDKYYIIFINLFNVSTGFFTFSITNHFEEDGYFSLRDTIKIFLLKIKPILLTSAIYIMAALFIKNFYIFSSGDPLSFGYNFNNYTDRSDINKLELAMALSIPFIFVYGLILENDVGIISALRLSCKAFIKNLIPFFSVLIAMLLFAVFISVATEMLPFTQKIEWAIEHVIAYPFYVILSILPFTAWAAIFRDGSMKKETEDLNTGHPSTPPEHLI